MVGDLKSISYSKTLREFTSDYNAIDNKESPQQDLEVLRLIERTLSDLFTIYVYQRPGSYWFNVDDKHKAAFWKPLSDFEQIQTDAKDTYREHFFHQFNVFLLGCVIIERYIDDLTKVYEKRYGISTGDGKDMLEEAWLFASTFHDVAYAAQTIRKWVTWFFDTLFLGGRPIARFEWSELVSETTSLIRLDWMISFLEHTLSGTSEDWDIAKASLSSFTCRNLLIDRLRPKNDDDEEVKSHGVLSALTLLYRFVPDNPKDPSVSANQLNRINKVIVPAALAIAMHHFRQEEVDIVYEALGCDVFQASLLPLSCLLLFCDNAQEWSRYGKSEREHNVSATIIGDISFDTGVDINLEYQFLNRPTEDRQQILAEIDKFKPFVEKSVNFDLIIDKEFKINYGVQHPGGRSGGPLESIIFRRKK